MGTLLLRSGRVLTVSFYGGQGGGSKKKSSVLELGFLLKVEVSQKGRQGDIVAAKEWELGWHHRNIRSDINSFTASCLMFEIIKKLAEQAYLDDEDIMSEQSRGIFSVLSNSLFYLDKKLEQEGRAKKSIKIVFAYFMAKLLIELGVFPETKECILTGEQLGVSRPVQLLFDQGGFAYSFGVSENELIDDRSLWIVLNHASQTKFQELNFNLLGDATEENWVSKKLFMYFCHQFQFSQDEFKSFKMVF